MKHELSLPYLLLKPLLDQLPADLQFLNSDHVVMITLITLLVLIGAPVIGSRLRQGNRGKLQQTLEVAYDAIRGLVKSNVHHDPQAHYYMIAGLALTVLLFNLSGALPLVTSPTPHMSTTVALAIMSFLYYNVQGIRKHGVFGYFKTFMGPFAVLAPIMLVSELISHSARLLSLSLRLAGSMSADHVVIGAFTSLFPFVLPAPMVALGLLMAFLQTFIFTLLSTIYISVAVSDEH